ncbi:MAG: hypothetical protein JJE30_04060 [Desulfuromonadales bacterium]|nr:hypothetical protein [Desulfuromonadales bacterium]
MIHDYIKNLADQMGIELSRVEVVDGQDVGCNDVSLLKLTTKGRMASALVYQTDIKIMQNGNDCDLLELKIRAALSRLNKLLDS